MLMQVSFSHRKTCRRRFERIRSRAGPGLRDHLAAIEQQVEDSDARLAQARERVESPAIATNAAALEEALKELDAAQQENDTLYARWAELTEKAG